MGREDDALARRAAREARRAAIQAREEQNGDDEATAAAVGAAVGVVQAVTDWICTLEVALLRWLPAMSVTWACMPTVVPAVKAVPRVMAAVLLVSVPVA